MIQPTMAVAAVGSQRFGRAAQSQQARFARLVALILDTIVVGILSLIATSVYGVTVITSGSPAMTGGGISFYTTQTEIPAIWTGLIWLGYYTICEAMFSATPGKAMNRLRVVSVDDRPLNLGSIVLRNLLRLIDVFPGMYLLGGVVLGLSPNSQRIGDLVARTTVVFREHALGPGAVRTSCPAARRALVAGVVAVLLFSAAFDYFGRPALVIQGMYNEHQLGNSIATYSLGQPARTLGTVTYPISARSPTQVCSGTITLSWEGLFGWQMRSLNMICVPS